MRIAKYSINAANYVHIMECDDWRENDSGYIRLSEIVDVEFPPLAAEIVVPQKLAALDEAEKELIAKHVTALEFIQSRRKDLLSLAPPKAVSEVA